MGTSIRRFHRLLLICVIGLVLAMVSETVEASCQGAMGVGRYDGGWWLSDQYANIGPAALGISSNRFTPPGTVLYDHSISFEQLWSSLPRGGDTTMIRCSSEEDARSVYVNIAGDSSYSLSSQVLQLAGVGQVWPFSFPGKRPTSAVFRLFGTRADGSWAPALGYPDRYSPANRFEVTGFAYEPVDDADPFPYKIKARHMPRIRLQILRYDGSAPYDYGDGPGAYLGVVFWGYGNTQVTADVYFAYIAIRRMQVAQKPACGVFNAPRVVDLPTATVGDIATDRAAWRSFTVAYECESGALQGSTLRVGLEPLGRVATSDSRYLLPDNAAGAARGVGIVYASPSDGGEARHWVRSSGCINRSQISNCPAASAQGSAEGWYPVYADTSGDQQHFSETFRVRMARLPGIEGDRISSGRVSATVNVMVNLK